MFLNEHRPNIVVIGGGTGSFTVLSGLKQYTTNVTALVNMADDGGSTGILRDELGILPPGDVRQCLAALSNTPQMRDLMNYRFTEGSMKGHAFGNLFLAALEKMTGSFGEAVELAGQVLSVSGKVEPITFDDVKLRMGLDDGTVIASEFEIGHAKFNSSRPKIWFEPVAEINPHARQAILEADIIVISPGNLYASLCPSLIVKGMREALESSLAKKVYVCNLVTKPGQTDNFKVHDFVDELERNAGLKFIDYVLYNSHVPSQELLNRYAKDDEFVVQFDKKAVTGAHYKVKSADMFSDKVWDGAQAGDPIGFARTFIRHDPDKVARQLMKLYFE